MNDSDSLAKKLKNVKVSKKEAHEFDEFLKRELMTPEEKYHTNKHKASEAITNYLHKILVKIAPMSKAEIRKPSTNNKLFDDIMAVFKTPSAKYLYAACPTDNIGSAVFYLQYDDMYFGGDNSDIFRVDRAKIIDKREHDIVLTKHAKAEFKRIAKKGYKYVHVYERWTWKPTKSKDLVNNKEILSQFNVLTKRDFMKMIRHITYDVSIYNIVNIDKSMLSEEIDFYKKGYKHALEMAEDDKNKVNNKQKKLKEFSQYLKTHKQPKNFRHMGY